MDLKSVSDLFSEQEIVRRPSGEIRTEDGHWTLANYG
jgi:hypothetical protein